METSTTPTTKVARTSVTDSCQELTKKAREFLAEYDTFLIETACRAARDLGPDARFHKITDMEFSAAGWSLPMFWAEASAERLMPRALCTEDHPGRVEFRKLCDDSFKYGRPELGASVPPGIEIKSPLEIVKLRRDVISDEEFAKLVAELPEYTELVKAEADLYDLYERAFQAATKRCDYGCGVSGPRTKCHACNKLYCSTSCLHSHEEREHRGRPTKAPGQ